MKHANALDLCGCICPFQREWGDQKHRQTISQEEMRSMLSVPRLEGVSRRSRGS